jgi:hypothetical protein
MGDPGRCGDCGLEFCGCAEGPREGPTGYRLRFAGSADEPGLAVYPCARCGGCAGWCYEESADDRELPISLL